VTKAFFDVVELGFDIAVFVTTGAQLGIISADNHLVSTPL